MRLIPPKSLILHLQYCPLNIITTWKTTLNKVQEIPIIISLNSKTIMAVTLNQNAGIWTGLDIGRALHCRICYEVTSFVLCQPRHWSSIILRLLNCKLLTCFLAWERIWHHNHHFYVREISLMCQVLRVNLLLLLKINNVWLLSSSQLLDVYYNWELWRCKFRCRKD